MKLGPFGFGAVLFSAMASTARADTTRLRIAVDTLPLQESPIKLDPKNAVLPDGVRDLSLIPTSWREQDYDGGQIENGHCTDDRRGSVATITSGSTYTRKIWEANGKTWLDTAYVEAKSGHVNVTSAERVPLVSITDGLWGYRRKTAVVLVAAQDNGFTGRGGPGWDCGVNESEVAAPSGTRFVSSSVEAANDAIRELASWSDPPKPRPPWVGVDRRIFASVSKSSSDSAPFLNLVIRKP